MLRPCGVQGGDKTGRKLARCAFFTTFVPTGATDNHVSKPCNGRTMTNEEYIQAHADDDVRALALRRVPQGVDLTWCLQQIEGRQIAARKLPQWAQTPGLWYPPHLSMEQCSSQQTALYKRAVVERLLPQPGQRSLLVDMTGGLGVDFSYLAPSFASATYVERLPHLCDVARHNLPLLGLPQAQVICAQSDAQQHIPTGTALVYLDPARRDGDGRRTVAIEDCTPNVLDLHAPLLSRAQYVMVKLSPMLDVHDTVRRLPGVCEVHAVSVRGECKELLLVMCAQERPLTYHCVNVTNGEPQVWTHTPGEAPASVAVLCDGEVQSGYLYEPNASILKAGIQDTVCRLGVSKLHPNSNLYHSPVLVPDFPGRSFCIQGCSDFSKRGIRALLDGVTQANLTIRNFPSTVAALRTKLRLREGGDVYLFATTLRDGRHVLLRCAKATPMP